jgi:hypothetical protein
MAITPENNQAQLGPIIPQAYHGLIYLEVLILSCWMGDIDTLPWSHGISIITLGI